MARALAQVVFQGTSALPEDVFVNTFHFITASGPVTEADADAISADLQSFYNTTHAPGTSPLASDISGTVSRTSNASVIKVYDLDDPMPRTPLKTYLWTLGAGSGSVGLPNEVALCLSYRAVPASGENPRTRRGRLYIGPLQSTNISGVGGDVIPAAAMINKLCGAGSFLAASATTTWAVYSRVEDQMFGVEEGWVDNAFDTQRRRGRKAQARTLWT